MKVDRFTALIDATVLSGALKRNITLSLAEEGFFRPRWSKLILDEVEKAVAEQIKDKRHAATQRHRIETAFPESLVTGFECLIDGLKLPDPNDCHVLAAAIETRASVLVTDNLKDFPAAVLEAHSIHPISPDDFIADVLDLELPSAVAALRRMRERFAKPALTAEALILKIESIGMPQTASILLGQKALL